MAMQDRAVCFDCERDIEHSPVFEAPCGHERCPSVVFHGVCLMRWRERAQGVARALEKWLRQHPEFGPR